MKTNEWLVEYCKAQVGRPYWYGCFGTKSSEKLLVEKKAQYPKYYTAKDYQKQIGVKVHDCAGLIKGALWSKTIDDPSPKYNAKQDFGATGFYNNAKVKGKIGSFPKTIGALVFKGTADKKTHVGVYIGNDRVIEAKGHSYGVINSKFTGGGWTYWAECHLIEYKSSPVEAPNSPSKPIADIAAEVIAGKWGNGTERKNRLIAAGYDYNEVQAKVNELLKDSSKPATYTTYTVKKGDTLWGISQKLLGKGSRYKEIRSLNGLKSDTIRTGQVLKIPAK